MKIKVYKTNKKVPLSIHKLNVDYIEKWNELGKKLTIRKVSFWRNLFRR